MLTLGTVLEALTGQTFEGWKQVITDASIDSRLVIPGALFVAIKGENVDGHDFVCDAFQRGAVAALVERPLENEEHPIDLTQSVGSIPTEAPDLPVVLQVANTVEALQRIAEFWRETLPVRVVGITGSVGKSTTKELAAEILSSRYRTLKNPGNMNNEIGLPLSLLRLSEAHDRAVLEMGFYVPGEISLLTRIAKPEVGVITNISQVHMERAGSLDSTTMRNSFVKWRRKHKPGFCSTG
jgi:UDP-N-acetylmuramoyl-tripeptide--D-alanyl-D-alanine ligase